jgi:hypothetical protein
MSLESGDRCQVYLYLKYGIMAMPVFVASAGRFCFALKAALEEIDEKGGGLAKILCISIRNTFVSTKFEFRRR